jgi:DNA repair protein RadD
MIKLRDYQKRGVDLIKESFMRGNRRVMAIAPPGAGKGTVICKLAVDAAMKANRCLIAVHRPDLLDGPNSISVRLEEQFGFHNYGWYMAGKPKGEKPVMLGSKDTMIRRKIAKNIDLVIIDECHRVASLTYQKLLAKFPNAYIIGFTATPFRGDKKTFENDFDDLIQMATYQELVKKGKLVKTRAIAPNIDLDLTGLHLRGGDFKNDELLERYDNERIYTGIVNKWLELSANRKNDLFYGKLNEALSHLGTVLQRGGC